MPSYSHSPETVNATASHSWVWGANSQPSEKRNMKITFFSSSSTTITLIQASPLGTSGTGSHGLSWLV